MCCFVQSDAIYIYIILSHTITGKHLNMHKQITLHRLEKSVHNNLLNSKQGLTYTVKTVVFLKFIVNAIF